METQTNLGLPYMRALSPKDCQSIVKSLDADSRALLFQELFRYYLKDEAQQTFLLYYKGDQNSVDDTMLEQLVEIFMENYDIGDRDHQLWINAYQSWKAKYAKT